jgi:hypothetical protein
VLLRIQKGKIISRSRIHEATKSRNATTASPSQLLYLAIFPISRNISLASWTAKITEPARDNLIRKGYNIKIWPSCVSLRYKRAITLSYIPANIGHNNQNNSCQMVRHRDSEVLASCFPEQKSKDGICVKSGGIHVYSLKLQSGRKKNTMLNPFG